MCKIDSPTTVKVETTKETLELANYKDYQKALFYMPIIVSDENKEYHLIIKKEGNSWVGGYYQKDKIGYKECKIKYGKHPTCFADMLKQLWEKEHQCVEPKETVSYTTNIHLNKNSCL